MLEKKRPMGTFTFADIRISPPKKPSERSIKQAINYKFYTSPFVGKNNFSSVHLYIHLEPSHDLKLFRLEGVWALFWRVGFYANYLDVPGWLEVNGSMVNTWVISPTLMVTPPKKINGWNLEMMVSNRNLLFQGAPIFR